MYIKVTLNIVFKFYGQIFEIKFIDTHDSKNLTSAKVFGYEAIQALSPISSNSISISLSVRNFLKQVCSHN